MLVTLSIVIGILLAAPPSPIGRPAGTAPGNCQPLSCPTSEQHRKSYALVCSPDHFVGRAPANPLAGILVTHSRANSVEGDVPVRLGGDEFAVALDEDQSGEMRRCQADIQCGLADLGQLSILDSWPPPSSHSLRAFSPEDRCFEEQVDSTAPDQTTGRARFRNRPGRVGAWPCVGISRQPSSTRYIPLGIARADCRRAHRPSCISTTGALSLVTHDGARAFPTLRPSLARNSLALVPPRSLRRAGS